MTTPQISCRTKLFSTLLATTTCCGLAIVASKSAAAASFSCGAYECNYLYTLNQNGSITEQTLSSTFAETNPSGGYYS
jgi:hypothetical protein